LVRIDPAGVGDDYFLDGAASLEKTKQDGKRYNFTGRREKPDPKNHFPSQPQRSPGSNSN
jgi:hypothetical protein